MNDSVANTTSLSHYQMLAVAYTAIGSSSLSIIGAGSVILGAVCKRRICSPEVSPICQLSLADFLASFFLLVGAALYTQQENITKPIGLSCSVITALAAAFFLCTFLLTLSYAVEVYIRIHMQRRRQTGRCQKFPVYQIMSAISWILPVASLITIVVTRRKAEAQGIHQLVPADHICDGCLLMFHYSRDLCWKESKDAQTWHMAGKLTFIVPLLVVIVGNLVFYCLAIKAFRESQSHRGVLSSLEENEEKRIIKKTILYQLIFVILWAPSLLLGFLSLSPGFNMGHYFPLYIIQMVLSPSQGFWNSLIYGWKRKGFTRALNEPESSILSSTNAPTYSTFSF